MRKTLVKVRKISIDPIRLILGFMKVREVFDYPLPLSTLQTDWFALTWVSRVPLLSAGVRLSLYPCTRV